MQGSDGVGVLSRAIFVSAVSSLARNLGLYICYFSVALLQLLVFLPILRQTGNIHFLCLGPSDQLINVCPAVSLLLVLSEQVALIVHREQVVYEILFVPTYSFNVPHHLGDAHIKTCGYFFLVVPFAFPFF